MIAGDEARHPREPANDRTPTHRPDDLPEDSVCRNGGGGTTQAHGSKTTPRETNEVSRSTVHAAVAAAESDADGELGVPVLVPGERFAHPPSTSLLEPARGLRIVFDTFVGVAPSLDNGAPCRVAVAFEAAARHHRYHGAFTHPNGDERWPRPR